jgi:hypothetical protein
VGEQKRESANVTPSRFLLLYAPVAASGCGPFGSGRGGRG